MTAKNARLTVGALTGLVSLIAMIRLVSGAFSGAVSLFAWIFILVPMVPWIGYAAWRARHSHIAGRAAIAVVTLGAVGLLTVWLSTLGAVVALVCSLAAFVVIWVHDWPPRRDRSDEQFVRIEDLAVEDSDEVDGLPDELLSRPVKGPRSG
jgi:hypothetical protein